MASTGTFERAFIALPEGGLSTALPQAGSAPRATATAACFHCGEPCRDSTFHQAEKVFCCQGCQVVYELLAESGLGQFYDLSRHPGVRIRSSADAVEWACLDEPALQQRLVDFADGKLSRVTFKIPAIHCVACVWLLENLFRLHPGVGQSEVNFPRREVSIQFATGQLRLSQLVALLASIGYQPQLTLGELEQRKPDPGVKKRWLQVGLAGFAFGNIMLFSVPSYLGLDGLTGPMLKTLFGYLSLALAAPVLVYSASDYWQAAVLSARRRQLTLEVPIALGLAALYAQSAFEIISGRGAGYLDSLAGLVFFLLCGRAFQQTTHERIAFERDYKCFFPLTVRRKTPFGEESASLSDVRVGDHLLVRNGELIPADARLVAGQASIDYSFVTGECEPVTCQIGAHLYAGGQQAGCAIEVETVKPVSQSYLTSLWSHEAFQKPRPDNLNTLTNHYSRRFTRLVICVALGAALFWALSGDLSRGLKAFTSVLIVACPCALALAAPFALGTAQRLLARAQVFLKNALVLERLAQIDAIVFDKTGTLTAAKGTEVTFHSLSGNLEALERDAVSLLTRLSTHPHCARIGEHLQQPSHSAVGAADGIWGTPTAAQVRSFAESPGQGINGDVNGFVLRLGSRAWLENSGIELACQHLPPGSVSYLAINGRLRGAFVISNALRPQAERFLGELGRHYELALLSGDNEKERARFAGLFGHNARLHFNQSPLDKLGFIRALQDSGKTVMMVGDGLNDAGALKQSDVGVAVVEKVGAFSPASDVILAACQVPHLFDLLRLARRSAQLVRWSFGISALYNLIGISIAAAGLLSPVVCAILMPLSSVSVVLFACGTVHWATRHLGLLVPQSNNSSSEGRIASSEVGSAAIERVAPFPVPRNARNPAL